jgi:hypothetical protein
MAIKTFTTGEVLTAADTNTYLANSGWVYVTSVDFAGNTATNIDGCFTSTYDTYQIVVNGYRAASGGYLYVQTRASAVTDTGTNYVYNESFGSANINETSWRLAYAYNTTDRTNTIITVYNPLSTATGTGVSCIYSARNGTAAFFTNLTSGQKQTQTADTGLRFTSSAGAVAMNGIVTIYGARKA